MQPERDDSREAPAALPTPDLTAAERQGASLSSVYATYLSRALRDRTLDRTAASHSPREQQQLYAPWVRDERTATIISAILSGFAPIPTVMTVYRPLRFTGQQQSLLRLDLTGRDDSYAYQVRWHPPLDEGHGTVPVWVVERSRHAARDSEPEILMVLSSETQRTLDRAASDRFLRSKYAPIYEAAGGVADPQLRWIPLGIKRDLEVAFDAAKRPRGTSRNELGLATEILSACHFPFIPDREMVNRLYAALDGATPQSSATPHSVPQELLVAAASQAIALSDGFNATSIRLHTLVKGGGLPADVVRALPRIIDNLPQGTLRDATALTAPFVSDLRALVAAAPKIRSLRPRLLELVESFAHVHLHAGRELLVTLAQGFGNGGGVPKDCQEALQRLAQLDGKETLPAELLRVAPSKARAFHRLTLRESLREATLPKVFGALAFWGFDGARRTVAAHPLIFSAGIAAVGVYGCHEYQSFSEGARRDTEREQVRTLGWPFSFPSALGPAAQRLSDAAQGLHPFYRNGQYAVPGEVFGVLRQIRAWIDQGPIRATDVAAEPLNAVLDAIPPGYNSQGQTRELVEFASLHPAVLYTPQLVAEARRIRGDTSALADAPTDYAHWDLAASLYSGLAELYADADFSDAQRDEIEQGLSHLIALGHTLHGTLVHDTFGATVGEGADRLLEGLVRQYIERSQQLENQLTRFEPFGTLKKESLPIMRATASGVEETDMQLPVDIIEAAFGDRIFRARTLGLKGYYLAYWFEPPALPWDFDRKTLGEFNERGNLVVQLRTPPLTRTDRDFGPFFRPQGSDIVVANFVVPLAEFERNFTGLDDMTSRRLDTYRAQMVFRHRPFGVQNVMLLNHLFEQALAAHPELPQQPFLYGFLLPTSPDDVPTPALGTVLRDMRAKLKLPPGEKGERVRAAFDQAFARIIEHEEALRTSVEPLVTHALQAPEMLRRILDGKWRVPLMSPGSFDPPLGLTSQEDQDATLAFAKAVWNCADSERPLEAPAMVELREAFHGVLRARAALQVFFGSELFPDERFRHSVTHVINGLPTEYAFNRIDTDRKDLQTQSRTPLNDEEWRKRMEALGLHSPDAVRSYVRGTIQRAKDALTQLVAPHPNQFRAVLDFTAGPDARLRELERVRNKIRIRLRH